MPLPTSPSAPTGAGSPPEERLTWLDAAKGCSILLVVLHHVVTKYLETALPVQLLPVADAWRELTMLVKPLRMPVFFVISGFLVAGAVRRPWRQVVRRFASPYYLFVVWSVVYVGVYLVETEMPANRTTSVGELARELLWASTSMWFLYALAVYFVLARLLRGVPPAAVLGASAALALWTGWSGIEEVNKASVLSHFGYFALGAYWPGLVRWLGERSGRFVAGLVVAYGVAYAALDATGLPWSVTLVGSSLLGIPLGLAAFARLADVRGVGSAAAWLGRRTLRVYVLHFAMIAVVLHVPLMVTSTGLGGVAVALALPVVVTVLVTAMCLTAHRLLVGFAGGALFRLPRTAERLLERLAQDPAWTGQPGARTWVPRDSSSKPSG